MVTDQKIIDLHSKGPISQAMEQASEDEVQRQLDRMGYPSFGRVNVPIRDRHALPRYADMLKGLANELLAISQAEHLNDYEAAVMAVRKCQALCKDMLALSKTPQEWTKRR